MDMKVAIKKIYMQKAIAVLLLATAIITASIANVGAYDHMLPMEFVPWEYESTTLDEEHTTKQKAMELFQYCDSLCTYFNCFPEDLEAGGFIYHVDGTEALGFYDPDEALESAVRKVYNEVYCYPGMDFSLIATNEYFLAYYDELKEASKKPEVANNEIDFLIKICEKENNDNGFYNDEVWVPFVEALSNAKEAYNKNTNNGENAYSRQVEGNSKIYWDLYFAYNDLCLQIKEVGDIDGDGEASIIDVTLLQRNLSGMTPRLNAAQRCAGCLSNYNEYGNEMYPDIVDATLLQRYLALMSTRINDYTSFGEYARCISFKANPLIYYEYYARMFPWYYNE